MNDEQLDGPIGQAANFYGISLTNVIDPRTGKLPVAQQADHIPIDEGYAEQYAVEERRAYERMTSPGKQTLGEETGAQSETEAQPVAVDITEGGLTANAEAAAALPDLQRKREKLKEDVAQPGVRSAVDTFLKTMTGGVLSLGDIDAHAQALAEGKPSPLAEKLRSIPELLKMIDIGGNTFEALARDKALRDGLPPEIADQVGSAAGLIGGFLTPLGPKGKKAVTTVLQNSLFSNPASHAANVASNMLTTTWAIPERLLSAAWSAAEYGLTLGSHERSVFFGESGAMLVGAVTSITDAIIEFGHVLRTGKSTIAQNIMQDIAGGALLPVRLLGAEDAASKTILRSMEIYAEAYRASARTGNLSLRNIKAMVEHPSPLVELRADQFAITNTFQQAISELGPNFERMGGVGEKLQDISFGAIPLGRLVVPVLRTQMNMAHFALERTPILNALASTWRADVAAGGVLRAQAVGKLAGGSSMVAAFMYFANAGIITGGGPIDPVLRRNKIELEGWRPYSIKIGDEYYAYDRAAGPLGAVLGLIADTAEIGGQLRDHKMVDLATAIVTSISRNMTSKTFMQGAADFLAAGSGDLTAFQRLDKSLVSVITPGMMRAITRSYDPVKRDIEPGADPEQGAFAELRRYVNELKAQTPGFSKDVEPIYNLWGAPVMLPSGWGPNWVSPVYTGTLQHDPAGDEIIRLGKAGLLTVHKANRVIGGSDPEAAPPDVPVSALNTGVPLTDREYGQYQRLAGNELKVDGVGMHDALNKIVDGAEYKNEMNDVQRALTIATHIGAYRRAAVAELLDKNQGLQDAWVKNIEGKGAALGAAPQPRPRGSFNLGGVPQ